MRNRLFRLSRGHSSLTIDEEGEQIIFVETLCFDYNTGEWDTFVAEVSRSDFIKGAKEFLETGKCEVDELRIGQLSNGHIFISVGKGDTFIMNYQSKVGWFIDNEFDVKHFREGLVEIIRQDKPNKNK